MSNDGFEFLHTEDCVLTMNYAWFHKIGCASLLLYLYWVDQTHHFEAGHNFGIFGMLMDYGVMYLVKGTRTLSVLPYDNGEDTDDLHGIGTFLFFGWFDWLGGFALMVFARNISDVLSTGSATKTNAIVILQHVLMWWTAPYFTVPNQFNNHSILLPDMLRMDDRTLVLSRSSPKSTYLVLLVVFTLLLWKKTKCTQRQYAAILASGLACGSLHHLALYFYGMRGYDSPIALVATLATEWPALLCGEAYLRMTLGNNSDSKPTVNYSKHGRYFLLTALFAIVVTNLPNDEDLTEFLISVIPGQHMQSLGMNMLWAKTCIDLPSFLGSKEKLECIPQENDDDSIWVISTPAKSGAVLRCVIHGCTIKSVCWRLLDERKTKKSCHSTIL